MVIKMIELKGIGFSYPGDELVLDGIDFRLNKGQRIGLVGANGSGKSTLMRIIMGLEIPQSGEVFLFNNVCEKEEDFSHARRRMGFLFQDSEDQLFSPTVEEDIAFGPLNLGRTHKEAREDVAEITEQLGIGHLRKSVTHKLSCGQKRIVALATAAAMRPEVFILDEPTSGLDDEGMKTLFRFLDEHVETCLIATHDKRLLSEATDREFRL